MNGKLFIHATNVHHGGGRTLLEALLKLSFKQDTIALLDERMPVPEALPSGIRLIRVKASLSGRLHAERLLAAQAGSGDTILCFGNLPPLFKVAGRVIVFVQNRYLIDRVSLNQFSIRSRLRLRLERLWFRMRAGAVDEYVVQTPSMKHALERHLATIRTKPGLCITILPFVGEGARRRRTKTDPVQQLQPVQDFVYVASGEPHKNHRSLVNAWILLAQANCYPSLALTIDAGAFPDLCRWIEEQTRMHQLHIENHGALPQARVTDLYHCSGALIYPSTLESFGLPLIEARNAGLAVLAGELDYVRDILDPEESFDPQSAVSIARAVKRFTGMDEPALSIVDARTFMDCLTSGQQFNAISAAPPTHSND